MSTIDHSRRGFLYFLQVGEDGPIKVGFTNANIHLRIRALQAASPHDLRWIGACPAIGIDERQAHRLLAPYRLRSEWFHPVPAVLSLVRDLSVENFAPDRFLDEYMHRREAIILKNSVRSYAKKVHLCEQAKVAKHSLAAFTERLQEFDDPNALSRIMDALEALPAPAAEPTREVA